MMRLYRIPGRPGAAQGARRPDHGSRALFEDLLAGRDFLYDELSLADVTVFPFLKYAVIWEQGDSQRFHEILRDHLALRDSFPRLEAWIHRIDALPRA